jgi:hypothetical protein
MGALLFILVFGVYIGNRGVIQSSDGRYTLHVAMSIIHAGNVDLDEFAGVIDESDYRVSTVDGHLVSRYPIGTPILIVPLAYVIDHLVAMTFGINLYDYLAAAQPDTLVISLDLAIASAVTALTTVVIFGVGRYSLNVPLALLLAMAFAFGTSAWSTASRGLWQHGPSMLLLSLCLLLALAARDKPRLIQFLGFLLAIAYVIRPTNMIPAALFTVYVFLAYRPYFVGYVLGAMAVGLPFLLSNLAVYGRILPPYYWPDGVGAAPDLGAALLGTLISPSRGLLVFSPFLILCVYGVILKVRRREFDGLDFVIVGSILLHWFMISSWAMWWGGTSYGPRLFTDMTPFFMALLIPVFSSLSIPRTPAIGIFLGLITVLLIASFAIHYRGATQPETWLWSMADESGIENVDQAPNRVWDWSDPQFLRGVDSFQFDRTNSN